MVEQEQNRELKRKSDFEKMAENMMETYINRDDCFALQLPSGVYYCVKEPVTPRLIERHLNGKITLGTYTLSKESTAKFCVLDADDKDNFDRLEFVFRNLLFPSYLEYSRRGGHLWFFFEEPVSGKEARNFGLEIAKIFRIDAEVFPKQTVSKGPGSCIRLPFGIHRKSGTRYQFAGFSSSSEQLIELSKPAGRIPLEIVMKYQYKEPIKRPFVNGNGKDHVGLPMWERIKQKITVRELIEQFVDLNDKGIGRCPFHDDEKPSFSVNEKENYWNCFAGCGGGSVIDFWMKFNHMEFKEAVDDLAERLGLK